MPSSRCALGSVSRSAGSITVRTGQWNAPTRFFPCGRSIAVLPPIAASTCATRLVGTGTHGTPRRYVAAAKPGGVGRAAAAERDDRAVAAEAQLLPEPRDGGERLRLLARRQLVRLGEARAERELRVDPWMPATCGSETSATGPSPGTSSREPLRARRARRRRRRRRGRRRGRPSRRRRRPRRRARGAPRTGCGTRPRRWASGRSLLLTRSQHVSTSTSSQIVSVSRSASRTRGDVTAPPPSAATTVSSSSVAEDRLAFVAEDLRDRLAGRRLDERVGVDSAERARGPRLPRAHEPDDRDVLQMRSMYARHAADEVAERVAAELLARGAGELPRDRGLGDDRERLDGGDVAPLDERLGRLAGREVDGAERLHERRQRLHRGADDDLLAVRDAGLDPAGAVRGAALVGADLVVRLRAAQAGEREAVADLDALHRLDPHHRRGEARVEAVLLAARTSRGPAGRRSRAPRRGRRACPDPCAPRRPRRDPRLPRAAPPAHLDPDLAEKRLRDGSRPRRTRRCAAPRRARARRARRRARTSARRRGRRGPAAAA